MRPGRKTCPHCRAVVEDLTTHLRDAGDRPDRPPAACPVLFELRAS